MKKRALCIISGGMDSTLCAYLAKKQYDEIVALHFDYGQRTQNKERECFYNICDDLGVSKQYCLDATFIKSIGNNALTDIGIEIPKNIYNTTATLRHANIKQTPATYVPFRNGIFLAIAGGIAEQEKCESIFIGVIENDNSGYPDCTQKFIQKAQDFINDGRATTIKTTIQTPLIHLNKTTIVKLAVQYNIPLHLTWSCYEREDIACGKCDSCILRLRGFMESGYNDTIPYM